MKTALSLICIMLLLNITPSEAKKLQARFAYNTFFAPGNGPYVETNLNIRGHSVSFNKTGSGQYQGKVEVTLMFRQADSVKYFDKYNLLSPLINDTVNDLKDFTDVQRIKLPNGNYTIEMIIKDEGDSDAKPYRLQQDLVLAYYPNVVSVSDISLLTSYQPSRENGVLVKNGYEMIPFVDNFYSSEMNTMKVYAEVYNTAAVLTADEPYILACNIVAYEGKHTLENFGKMVRQQAKPVNVLLTDFDITDLPSGNYNLVFEVRNRNNEILASREIFFQRSKAPLIAESGNTDYRTVNITNTFAERITSRDSIAEYIKMLWPISSPNENTFAMNQLEMADIKLMQQYFYDFWQKRNPQNPALAWNEYHAKVDKVNSMFSVGKKKGYMTERGRVYLQYGAPNQVADGHNEPNTYPYEIWQYYKIKNQTNRKFVFYNPELASNEFRLLHSDATGEITDPAWQVQLKKRTEKMHDLDKEDPRNTYGNQFDQLFSNPR